MAEQAQKERWTLGTIGPNAHYLKRSDYGEGFTYTRDPSDAAVWDSRSEAAKASESIRGLFANVGALRLTSN